ncbi:MAG TPA: hypothetical protein VF861_04080 [Telluria sp.]
MTINRNRTLRRSYLLLMLLAAQQVALGEAKWQPAQGGGIQTAFQLALRSNRLAGFDQGELVKGQIFSNLQIGLDVAAAVVWNSRYPGVTRCVLLSKNSAGVLLLAPPEPDPDLPLSCTGEVAVAFESVPAGSRVLAVFGYVSPSRATIYYPLVVDVNKQQAAIDVASTESANKARDKGRKLVSIADLKAVLGQRPPVPAASLELQGFYASPSRRCTRYDEEKDDFVSCARQFNDCLLIRRSGPAKMTVEIQSTQADQHVCAVNGTARLENGLLTYRFSPGPDSQRLLFTSAADKIVLKHVVPAGEAPENCGAHASFDGLEFKRIDRNASKHLCFKDD